MTPSEIATLRALCDAATPGPWHVNHGDVLTNQSHPLCTLSAPTHRMVMTRSGGQRVGEDAAFIAAARTAVPALLSALEEARAEVAKWKAAAEVNAEDADARWERLVTAKAAAESRADALQAEVEKMQESRRGASIRIDGLLKDNATLAARADAAWRALRTLVATVRGYECESFGHDVLEAAMKDAEALLAPLPSSTAAPAYRKDETTGEDGPPMDEGDLARARKRAEEEKCPVCGMAFRGPHWRLTATEVTDHLTACTTAPAEEEKCPVHAYPSQCGPYCRTGRAPPSGRTA